MDLVPLRSRREGPQDDVTQNGEADQDHDVGDAAGFQILQPLLEHGLTQPPAGNALLRQHLREYVPDHDGQQRVEQKLDEPRGGQLALRQQWANEQNRSDEPRKHPQHREIGVLRPDDVEVQLAGQKRRIDMLDGQHQSESGLEEEQHQHHQEEAQAEALGLVFDQDHGLSPSRLRMYATMAQRSRGSICTA